MLHATLHLVGVSNGSLMNERDMVDTHSADRHVDDLAVGVQLLCGSRVEDSRSCNSAVGSFGVSRSRGWVFTAYYESSEVGDQELFLMLQGVQYFLYGWEKCPSTGRLHAQGFLYLKNACSHRSARLRLRPHHVERQQGSVDSNVVYCSKSGDTRSAGVRPLSSKEKGETEQTKWRGVRLAIMEGRLDDIDDSIYIRYYSSIRAIQKDNMLKVADAPDVCGIWIHGPAGCGKSRYARETYADAYCKPTNKWWDGYKGEKFVIIDDWDPSHSKYLTYHLKMWSDRYSITAEIKGGALNIRPEKIIVTSQYSIEECFEDCASRDAIRRRFTVIPPAYFSS